MRDRLAVMLVLAWVLVGTAVIASSGHLSKAIGPLDLYQVPLIVAMAATVFAIVVAVRPRPAEDET